MELLIKVFLVLTLAVTGLLKAAEREYICRSPEAILPLS
jgi:hypothetical protein